MPRRKTATAIPSNIRGIVRYIAVRRELSGELGVGEGEFPHRDGKAGYATRVVVTNGPSPGDLGGEAACQGQTVSDLR